MADVIIVEYQGKIDKLEQQLKQLEKEQLAVDSGAKTFTKTIETGAAKATAATSNITKETSGLSNKLNQLAGQIPGVYAAKDILGFADATRKAAIATESTSVAMKLLRVAFISTGIGAFVVLLGSLVAYFTQTEAGGDKLAKIMRVLGAVVGDVVKVFTEIGNEIINLIPIQEKASIANDDYKKSTIDLAEEIADLEDHISELSITIDINNNILQTGIEKNLRALRNRNITYQESLKLIEQNGVSEKKQLENSNKLITEGMDLERKQFILKVKNSDLLSEADLKSKEETLKNANTVFGVREKLIQREIDNHNIALANLKEQTTLFDKFVNHQVDATSLLNNVQGEYTKEDLERVSTLIIAKENAVRNQSNAEEKLQNFKDAAADKEKARLAKEEADKIKAAQDEQKRLDDALKARLEKIKNQAKNEEIIAKQMLIDGILNEQEFQETIQKIQTNSLNNQKKALKQYGKDYADIDNSILDIEIKNMQTQDKEYADMVLKQSIEDSKNRDEKEKNNKEALDKELKDDADFYDNLSKQGAEAKKKAEEKEKEHQANIKSIITNAATEAQNFLNKQVQRDLENKTSQVNAEIASNDKKTQSLLDNIDKQQQAGEISQQTADALKASIQAKSDKRDQDLKKKNFEQQKKADIQTAEINTAAAIIKTFASYGFTPPGIIAAAAAAAEGAIEIAFIKSRKFPAFKDGIIDFKGKGNGTSDENPVMISNRESIITAKQTVKYKGLLGAINNDSVEKYLTKDYLKPILAKQQRITDQEKEQMQAALKMSLLSNGIDTSHMERLIKNNKTVNLGNVKELGKTIAKEIKLKDNSEMK